MIKSAPMTGFSTASTMKGQVKHGAFSKGLLRHQYGREHNRTTANKIKKFLHLFILMARKKLKIKLDGNRITPDHRALQVIRINSTNGK